MEKNMLMLSNYPPGLKNAWKQFGYKVVECKDSIIELEAEEISDKITELKEKENIGCVFSFDYSPKVADICYLHNIIYISWIVDSPHASLWSKTALYNTNFIFDFDYLQCQELYNSGNERMSYLPLATDVELFQSIIRTDADESEIRYGSDVAFMGNLYDSGPHNMFDKIQYLPPYSKGYLDSLMKAQRLVWGSNLIHTSITDKVWEELRENIILELENDYDGQVYKAFVEGMIHKKITQLERKEVCSYLARHFDFTLYTGSDTSYDDKIKNRGYIDYVREMPLVFYYSKININITLHSISTGIPLRVLDILACEGFCLTNYQEEIATYFEDGIDLVMYSDFEDMYDKIRYYLEHEDERKAIARAGYEKVRSQFDYIHGVEKIVNTIETYH